MIIGHQKIVAYFKRCLANDSLAHAYLFAGPEHLGKGTVALKLAQKLECSQKSGLVDDCQCSVCRQIAEQRYPDFSWLAPEKSEITIEQVRGLSRRLSLSTYQARYKIGVIDGAEKMNLEAANALLKTLEEPPPKSLLILLAHESDLVLPTIASRCQEINFLPVASLEIVNNLKMLYHKKDQNLIQQAVRLAASRPGLAINYLENFSGENYYLTDLVRLIKADLAERFLYVKKIYEDKEWPNNYLGQWLIILRDVLLAKIQCPSLMFNKLSMSDFRYYSSQKLLRLVRELEQVRRGLQAGGLNRRLILENLMINL